MDKQRVLVCSAWPYASGVPHLGDLVSSLMSGDVFARYYRLLGKDVLYVSGTDSHGTRIEFEAEQQGISPAELADRNHQKIVEVIEGFGIAFDNYTTTESSWHKKFVREIYLQMDANGFVLSDEGMIASGCAKKASDVVTSGQNSTAAALKAIQATRR